MKKLLAVLLAAASAAATLLPAIAQAQTPDSGFSAALRAGYGFPMGGLEGSAALSDQFSGQVPFWLDAGYRFGKNHFIGAYFQYGIAFVNESNASGGGVCVAGVTCSGSDMRSGVEYLYNFSPEASFQPWAGLGVGYEWLTFDVGGGGATATFQYRGWEFFNLQVGGDFKLSNVFGLGPFIALSFGQYETLSLSGTGISSVSGSIADKKIHEWLQMGVKGTFNF